MPRRAALPPTPLRFGGFARPVKSGSVLPRTSHAKRTGGHPLSTVADSAGNGQRSAPPQSRSIQYRWSPVKGSPALPPKSITFASHTSAIVSEPYHHPFSVCAPRLAPIASWRAGVLTDHPALLPVDEGNLVTGPPRWVVFPFQPCCFDRPMK